MYTKIVEKGLVMLGALIVLIGVSSAINMALAAEAGELPPTLKIETPATD
ncbi:MAG: hypothetical protein OER22_03340 [Gammaproteobacteria bacterium]|nr:hypothetical protein [Gammaproteobacteria bacterium]MDH3372771.1 hypothetical protein [Gammaproteobacteria bacterium]MDH3408073.1 hypothetical protein [Gammaproteobacteria bacterium]MDH3551628.1 hypothetical protein [Gammaproteobacteria bacterium]